MSEPATYSAPLRIGCDHPTLPGHFPGNPIVPGVVLLDHVQQAARQWLGTTVRVVGIPQAKFVQPLLPEQDARIELRVKDKELRFSIVSAEVVLAQGVMIVDSPRSAEHGA
jgi:3-hydroxymyristoyl/3-hydroxydecanoyl-(acyl carrier protein) dehydratase